jgi:hypothetical protein
VLGGAVADNGVGISYLLFADIGRRLFVRRRGFVAEV